MPVLTGRRSRATWWLSVSTQSEKPLAIPSVASAGANGTEPNRTEPNRTEPRGRMSDIELLERASTASRTLREAIGARVVGQGDVIELMLVALLAQGHALLVGVPGLA